MYKRSLLLAVTMIALLTGVASAQDYPIDTVAGTVDADGNIAVTADGFTPYATVRHVVRFTPAGDENALGAMGGYEGEVAFGPMQASSVFAEGTTQADASGAVDLTIVPEGDGTYEITMTDGTHTAVASVIVGAASLSGPSANAPSSGSAGAGSSAAGAAPALPRTGSDSSLPLGAIGAGLVAAGVAAALVARRRQGATAA